MNKRKLKCELYNDSMQGWKDIDGYEGLYQVSIDGLVRSLPHYARNNSDGGKRFVPGKILKSYKMPNGYHQVQLSRNEKREKKYLHRLVAIAFLKNHDGFSDVNHIDGNKDNNDVRNLEWVSHKDNQIHMVKSGLTKKAIPVMCMKTGDIYMSMTEAQKQTGVDRHYIKKSCEKQEDFQWRYLYEMRVI